MQPTINYNFRPILIYRTFRNAPKKRLKILHATLHGSAFVLSVVGLKAVFDSHNLAKKPIPNLYTLHSWIGLITIIIFAAQFLSGFISFLYPGLSKTMRQTLMPVHTAFGIGGFVLAVTTTMTGLTEKVIWTLDSNYKDFISEGIIFNLMGVFAVFYGIMVLYMVNELDYKRVATRRRDSTCRIRIGSSGAYSLQTLGVVHSHKSTLRYSLDEA
ncbi:hypothetical protein NQ318_001864 [Aromia moschata]|uniref:Cytochrome b561 domain-containing protein n=1 Tax=Aromia moschata TaxID=1265417 RepID=A0AAV8Z1D5_9CUCU|nr:hypothetical protein NQ318_001864 [Aromia moschata]